MDQIAQFETIPAPMAGIDAVVGLMEMSPNEALYAYNLIMTQNGPTVRPGWQEWDTNVAGSGGVRTIIPVRGAGTAGSQDYLFACTANGIYDCTSSTSAPTQMVVFPNPTGNAGYCEFDFATNLAGDVMLLVCDEVNGYWTFDTASYTWTQVTLGTGANQVSGVDPATFVSVRVFGAFVWFVQGGTGNGWYGPVGGGIYGAFTQFAYGNKFPHGGNLNNLYVFTYGSSYGTYTYLVAIGDAGDILAYQGINPSSASSWTLAGQWYVGDLPAGRRSCNNYGGDLTIVCSYGILKLSSLFTQTNIDDPTAHLDRKIAPALAADFALYSSNRGFGLVPWPSQNSLIVTEPIIAGIAKKQFCYNLATGGWSVFSNLDWQCAGYWHGALYAGTSDNRVIKMSGNSDAVLLDGTNAQPVTFGCLGSFQQGKSPEVTKIVDLIKPYFLGTAPIAYTAFARFDFDLTDLTLGTVPYTPIPILGGWDSGLWDAALWQGGSAEPTTPQISIYGAVGIGKWVSIGIIGATQGQTTLAGYGVSFRPCTGFFN
jgi:hypothetical protein